MCNRRLIHSVVGAIIASKNLYHCYKSFVTNVLKYKASLKFKYKIKFACITMCSLVIYVCSPFLCDFLQPHLD